MNELIIFTMLMVALNVGLTIALCVCIKKIIELQRNQGYEGRREFYVVEDWLSDISVKIDHLETQIPNRYKNQNGEIGILYRKEEDK